jgi:hypothetical protein
MTNPNQHSPKPGEKNPAPGQPMPDKPDKQEPIPASKERPS